MDWLYVGSFSGMTGGILLIVGGLVLSLTPVAANLQWYFAVGMIVTGLPLAMLSTLACVIGKILCCAAPAETGAAPLAWGSILCFVLALFFAVNAVQSAGVRWNARNSFDGRRGFSDQEIAGTLQSLSFSLAGTQLFVAVSSLLEICFLRTLAIYLRNETLVRSATNYLIYQVSIPIVVYVLVLATLGLTMLMGNPSGPQSLGISFWSVVCSQLTIGSIAIISYFWYFRVAQMSRSNVRDFVLLQPQ
jgi:hypothetical protein